MKHLLEPAGGTRAEKYPVAHLDDDFVTRVWRRRDYTEKKGRLLARATYIKEVSIGKLCVCFIQTDTRGGGGGSGCGSRVAGFG